MKNEGNKGGRPSKYDPKFCEEIVDFFDVEPYHEVETDEGWKRIPNNLPLLVSFAKKIGVAKDTLLEWASRHEEFSAALKKAKNLQEFILTTNGLHGLYNTAFAIFTAKNVLGWRDKVEVDGMNQNNLTINIGLEDAKRSALLNKYLNPSDPIQIEAVK